MNRRLGAEERHEEEAASLLGTEMVGFGFCDVLHYSVWQLDRRRSVHFRFDQNV